MKKQYGADAAFSGIDDGHGQIFQVHHHSGRICGLRPLHIHELFQSELMLHAGDLLLLLRAQIEELHKKHTPDADAVRHDLHLIDMDFPAALHDFLHIRLRIRHIHILIYGDLYIFFQL